MKRSNIASAVNQNGGRCNPNLSHKVLATTKIGQLLPIFHQETVPGDTVKLHSSMFCRTLPLSVPSYVNLVYRTMSVFVPYHQVADGVESFFANEATYRGKGNRIPLLTIYYLRNFFLRSDIASSTGATSSNYDLFIPGSTSSQDKYVLLTALGRYAMKVFHLLGYRFDKVLPYATSGSQGRQYNALPLLAMAHAYNSFMSYSPTQNGSQLSAVLEDGKRTANWVVTDSVLYTIFTSLLVTYEDSYFSTLWKNPYSSNTTFTNAGLKQVSGLQAYGTSSFTSSSDMSYADNPGTYTSLPSVNGNTTMTASQVRLLLKFDDFFRRSQYAGSKDIEKIYSQFGVKIDDYRTRYPYFLNETSKSVNIGDVTSTADSGEAKVGSYAGKAIGDGDAGFEYHSSDYGMLFTFAWFAPKPMFYTGVDKENLRLQPFDFYTPQLDQNLAVPVQYEQFFAEGNPISRTTVFGYEPLYLEYLYHNDYIVGDFETRADFTPWHFGFRKPFDNVGTITAQDDSLVYMPNTGTEFERIFMIDNTELLDVDTLYLTIDNDCRASRPMRDMTGKLGLGDGDVNVNINGSEVH